MSSGPEDRVGDTSGRRTPSAFKYLVGGAALFIAGCSAFFSVSGLGLLFVGSAVAVMVMAASLELGKLVAASFLYRYWSKLSIALRVYMTAAVVILIGITSLGNYGYLARAYEQTKTQIAMLETQIQSLQQKIDDTQKQIDDSRAQSGKASDFGHEGVTKLQQTIAQANQDLQQSLSRLEDRRRAAKDKRDRDAETLKGQLNEQAGVLEQGLASEQDLIAKLNDRVAVMDREVDAYTSQGGPGLFKDDGVKMGQNLRNQQLPERRTIAAKIDDAQKKEESLRGENQKTIASVDAQRALVEDQYRKDLSGLDDEEQALRKSNANGVADAQKQLASLQNQNQTSSSMGAGEIESMYQQIRSDNDAIQHIRQQIAATDIGSYRFVARAFNAPADDVVKWLMLVMVLVFDPLAVALTVGFNVALVRERGSSGIELHREQPVSRNFRRIGGRGRLAAIGIGAVALIGLATGGVFFGERVVHHLDETSHASMIPGDSFAVLTLYPSKLRQNAANPNLTHLFGDVAGRPMTDALMQLIDTGVDLNAALYGFVKYPGEKIANNIDRPVMLCGLIARVSDPGAAEGGLSKFADTLASTLSRPGSISGITRSREMIRYGQGRYLDPDGGFFTFAVTDHEAIVLLEIEGDPKHPTVESEIRQCLAVPDASEQTYGEVAKLPTRATSGDAPISLWFDAGRCFAQMPKNAAALARYQQLQRFLQFDAVLSAKGSAPGEFDVAGDYAYTSDRFQPGDEPSAAAALIRLGPADPGDIPGRLMDRCAATLDFDGAIEQLKAGLSRSQGGTQVLVEKTIASARDGKFVCTAHFGNPTEAMASVIENPGK